ncbi:RNA-directed DNA polymerase, eukaryota, partial [Tanacetum coccineum]
MFLRLPLLHGGMKGNGDDDANVVIEGHGDTADGFSRLHTQPSPPNCSVSRVESVKKPMHDQASLDAEALTEEHADLVQAHESCKDVKTRYKECKKELAMIQSAYDENVSAYNQLSKNYDGALTREKSLQDMIEEIEEEKKETEQLCNEQTERIKQLEATLKQSANDAHQLRLDRERYAVEADKGKCFAVGKGFIDGLFVSSKDKDVQAILKATSGVDPTSSDTFME